MPLPSPNSISLYIHIPFCAKKCRYCDFYSHRFDEKEAHKIIGAIPREWKIVSTAYSLRHAVINTLFCGGGTPSLIGTELWQMLQQSLFTTLPLPSFYEWSIECNPDSFSDEKAQCWLDSGVNRLTLGIQSLDNRMLRFFGRPHTAEQAIAVLENRVIEQFDSVGIDIMYGLPGQTAESLEKTLRQLMCYDVISHVSAYELTLSNKSPLGRHAKLLPLSDENEMIRMQRLIPAVLGEYGFEHYEVSSYAKPGHRCKHNMAYWTHKPYIGLGPSAHSYLPPKRFANSTHTARYIQKISEGDSAIDFSETLSPRQQSSEMIMLAMRTADGIDENQFKHQTGNIFCSGSRKAMLDMLIDNHFIQYEPPHWKPTEKGLLRADALARQLA